MGGGFDVFERDEEEFSHGESALGEFAPRKSAAARVRSTAACGVFGSRRHLAEERVLVR